MQDARDESGLIVLQAGSESESDAVFDSEVQQRTGGFVISTTPFFNSHREQLPPLAARHSIPTIYSFHDFATSAV